MAANQFRETLSTDMLPRQSGGANNAAMQRLLPLRDSPTSSGEPSVQVEGKFLSVNGRRFWIKGVTYGTFGPDEKAEPYPPLEQVRRDFEQMRETGINTVRLPTPPSLEIADLAAEAGLFLIPNLSCGSRSCDLESTEDKNFMRDWTRQHARRLARHPAILMYSVGNEIPPFIVRWHDRKKIENWIRELYSIAKHEAPDTLVTYVNHPQSDYLDLSFLDVASWNIYLENEADFRACLGRLQMLAGNLPLFLAEVGLTAGQHGDEAQSQFIEWQVRASFDKGACGLTVHSWTDQSHILASETQRWSFELTDGMRKPSATLRALQTAYAFTHVESQNTYFPFVSVIVCAYNSAATIEQCLQSLTRLIYPYFEIIVVDDGSTDNTATLAAQIGVRVIRSSRGGLSRARNTGISNARGSIIAFIDADAYADPHWLFFLVSSFEEHEACAVGGPNLTPPQDGFVAHCISHAPGNPTHVLLDSERAEHIPGCNMAYRKDALLRVGSFDPTHRAAGDDVDVCWKILAREEKIAYAPTAIVWHHRRPTIAAFLDQQRGYGYAEAHLQHKYPGHYNLFGHAVWQGRFGGPRYQSIYATGKAGWFQLFTTVEWMVVSAAIVCAGLLGIASSEMVAAAFAAAGLYCLGGTLSAVAITGLHAAQVERWKGIKLLLGSGLVALLHMAQPIARAWGRTIGWWQLKDTPSPYSPVQRLCGNLAQRNQWLHRLQRHLQRFGWIARPGSSGGRADIEILGPGPLCLQIESIYEENPAKGGHFVRYRVTKKRTAKTYGYLALCLGGLVLSVMSQLWPLLIPLGLFLLVLIYSENHLASAISQLGVEVGETLGMPRADET